MSPLVAGHARYLDTRSFASLDGLRAVSILAVVWLHTAGEASRWLILRRGFLGVDCFFVISGFLIATLLLRERRRTGTIALGKFYMRRALRIVPAYWLMLAAALCIAHLKPGVQSANIKHDFPYALFYVSNFVAMPSFLSITWSLSTEEQFYLVVPWLQKSAARLFPLILLPVGLLLAALPPFGVLPGVALPEFFRETTFVPILLGVLLAHVLDSPHGWRFVAHLLRSRWSSFGAALLLALALGSARADVSGWPRLTMQMAMLLLLAACVVREDHVLRRVLIWWPLRRIGIVSYGIYLYHMFVYWPVARLLGVLGWESDLLLFGGVAAGAWCVAEISYRSFELKFLQRKERFAAFFERRLDRRKTVATF